jgi:hypothetical protein
MGVNTLQVANPSMGTVTRTPQTTAATPAAAGVPFARLSRQGQIFGPSQSGLALGSLWTPLLKPVGGYLRYLILTVNVAVTGQSTNSVTVSQDAPYNAIQNIFFRDPFGQPIIQADGYSLFLINLYSGQVGALGVGNYIPNKPSYAAPTTGTGSTAGSFNFQLQLPLELDSSGYCSLPDMNASSQPQIQIQTNTATSVYVTNSGSSGGTGVAPSTTPALSLSLDEPFWMAPVDNPQAAPADVGSSAQWSVVTAAQGVNGGSYQRIQLPRVGTYIHTLILVLRDKNNYRIDAWPTGDLTLWFDGVPILMETLAERQDKMYTQFGPQGGSNSGGTNPPTGVIVYTFRNSIQSFVSNGDTYDLLAPTTPATLLEVSGTFQSLSSNGPALIQTIVGELFPLGGIPYTHLSM